jgi:hypothetical protein
MIAGGAASGGTPKNVQPIVAAAKVVGLHLRAKIKEWDGGGLLASRL